MRQYKSICAFLPYPGSTPARWCCWPSPRPPRRSRPLPIGCHLGRQPVGSRLRYRNAPPQDGVRQSDRPVDYPHLARRAALQGPAGQLLRRQSRRHWRGHLALRGAGAKIQPGSDRPLTFSGKTALTIPPGSLVLSDPVDLKAPAASDLAVSLYMPPGAVIAGTLHYSAQQTSYVAAGNICGAEDLPDSVTISSWPYLTASTRWRRQHSGPSLPWRFHHRRSRSTSDQNRRWPDILAAACWRERATSWQ